MLPLNDDTSCPDYQLRSKPAQPTQATISTILVANCSSSASTAVSIFAPTITLRRRQACAVPLAIDTKREQERQANLRANRSIEIGTSFSTPTEG